VRVAPPPKPRDEDLSTTDSFNLLFVIFGVGLLVLVGWNLYQRWSAKGSPPAHCAGLSETERAADARCRP
jgi:hypothetical protein